MPDAADEACIHTVKALTFNGTTNRLEYHCMDCGRVHAWLDGDQAAEGGVETVRTWGARHGVPESKISRYIRAWQDAMATLLTDIERAG